MSAGTHSKGPMTPKRHILFAVLDWGLGHATRSWPLILAARRSGAQVTVASRGAAAAWLQHRMTELVERELAEGIEQAPWVCLEKPGVQIRYAKGNLTLPRVALQLPRFLASIAAERRWLESLLLKVEVTHVVSDNCYGVCPRHHSIPSALITHQLAPPVPLIFRRVAVAQIRRWAEAFGEVWIPDTAEGELAGRLSGTALVRRRFIGPLSRFPLEGAVDLDAVGHHEPAAPKLVGLVSGPEPQRSLMKTALLRCFTDDGRTAVIFSGNPAGEGQVIGNVRIVPHADDRDIQRALIHAECIVCRSGYSSLMDLACLKLKATLVPTPGQPEQEYLAQHWQKTWGWPCIQQDHLATFSPPNDANSDPHTLPKFTHGNLLWFHEWISPSPPSARIRSFGMARLPFGGR